MVSNSRAQSDWIRVEALPATEMTAMAVINDTLYTGGLGRVYIHPLGTDTWAPSPALPEETDIWSLIRTGNRTIVGTFSSGVYELPDGGLSWQARNSGLGCLGGLSISSFAVRGEYLYAGTAGQGVFSSPRDGAITWTAYRAGLLPNTSYSIYSLFAWDDFLFTGAGINAEIYLRDGDDAAWTAVPFAPFDPNGLAMLSFYERDDTLFGAASNGFYISSDSGDTWTWFPVGVTFAQDGAFVEAGDRLYGVLTRSGQSFLFRWLNDNWELVDQLNGKLIYDMRLAESRLYAARFDGLWYLPLDPTDIPEPRPSLPSAFILGQNYPNPFNPNTNIDYSLPAKSHIAVEIFNLLGQKVRVLLDQEQPAGAHTVAWDGLDESGNPVASGIYLYRIRSGDFSLAKKMSLQK